MKKILAVAAVLLCAVFVVAPANSAPVSITNDVMSALGAKVGADSFFYDERDHLSYLRVVKVLEVPGEDPDISYLYRDYGEPKRPLQLSQAVMLVEKIEERLPFPSKNK